MNLKEAFRFQNRLQSLMEEAQSILGCDANITRVQNTYLRKKVMKNFENETTVEAPRTEYSEQITTVAEFLLYLLREREKLTVAICRAKAGLDLPAGLDGDLLPPGCCATWRGCAALRWCCPMAAPATASTTRATRCLTAAT